MSDQHELVVGVRRQVALLIGDEVNRRERQGLDALDDIDRRMMADAEIRRALTEDWRTRSQRGEAPLTRDQEEGIAEAVIASVFSALPGLDEYLARDDVTDIFINGCDDVRLRTMDGEEIVVPPLVVQRRRAGHPHPGPGPPGRAARVG